MEILLDRKNKIVESVFIKRLFALDIKTRCVLIGICFFIIFFLSYMYEMDKSYFADDAAGFMGFLKKVGQLSYRPRSIISGMLFLIAACCGLQRGKINIKRNEGIFYIWFLMNATFIIAGVFHNIEEGFLIAQIFVSIAVPIFYIGWMQSDNLDKLYWAFSIAVVTFYMITVIVCMIWFPYGSEFVKTQLTTSGKTITHVLSTLDVSGVRYMGVMDNPSRIAHFATPAAVCSLYLIYKASKRLCWIPAVSLGLAISMAVLCVSRASMISIALAVIGFIIICIEEKISWKRLLVLLVVIIISFNTGYFITNRGEDNLKLYSNNSIVETTYAENKEKLYESEETESEIMKRFKESGTLNQLSSGRIGIWHAFLINMNLSGHDVRYSYPLRVIVPNEKRCFYFSYPHNVAIDYGYRCGVITGILFMLLEITGLMYCIRALFSKKHTPIKGEAFAIMGMLAFLITGNVESVDHVFTRIILVVFYLSLIPVFVKNKNDNSVVQTKSCEK